MKTLILEDEGLASKKLEGLLHEIDPAIEVLDSVKSVEAGVEWLQNHEQPELIFSDIQLLDGLSFEIFKTVPVTCPVIFTTAYDQYAIQAFEVNSIDYLLKPVRKEKLAASLEKFHQRQSAPEEQSGKLETLAELLLEKNRTYKKRFLVKVGQRIRTVAITEVAYFFTRDKLTYLVTRENQKMPIDLTLEELDQQLDPEEFFRVNRKFVTHIEAVANIHPYFKGRVKLELEPSIDEDIVISSDKTPSFKQWLDR